MWRIIDRMHQCPTTIVPHFGDQFLWGERIYRKGVGPTPIPIWQLGVESLSEAIAFMLQPQVCMHVLISSCSIYLFSFHEKKRKRKLCFKVKLRSMELAEVIGSEDGVGAAVEAFHRHLPAELPLPKKPSDDDVECPNPVQWFFSQVGRLCCLPCSP